MLYNISGIITDLNGENTNQLLTSLGTRGIKWGADGFRDVLGVHLT